MIERVTRAERLRGTVRVPGDKSVAHRGLILGALAGGGQTVRGLPASGDLASTRRCLEALGCPFVDVADGAVRVGAARWRSGVRLDAGNSGTTTRLLAGLVAGLGLDAVLDGDPSLRRRPMTRIADPLRLMGASVETAAGGTLPLAIRGACLQGVVHHPDVASAQVKSCLLIAGLMAAGETTVVERAATRDHTERMLRAMGADVRRDGLAVSVTGGAALRPVAVDVPGDISSAAFFLAAATVVPRSEVRLPGVGVNPTRTGFLDVLRAMGADVSLENPRDAAGEPVADLVARAAHLRAAEVRGDLVPRLIDELPVLAVVAAQAAGETVVRDAAELRHKESDRIATTVAGLRALGAEIEERPDGFAVRGPTRLRGAAVDAGGDHRLAMALAVAGLAAEGETRIAGAEACGVSYPGFFGALRDLCT